MRSQRQMQVAAAEPSQAEVATTIRCGEAQLMLLAVPATSIGAVGDDAKGEVVDARQETLTQAAVTALAAASDYDRKKRSFRGTEEACRNQGVTFLPMVIETTGAWSEDATSVLLLMAKAMAVRSGRAAKEELQELLQNAAVSVRRANARACLRRRVEDVSSVGAALLSAQDVLTA
mmetsp:Transcript_56209/g.90963  ORF Transcript_56209/g.90963 Transcript_56209/m.90963 type:complete len:176 (+) Transcript_56209:773-1300(+)